MIVGMDFGTTNSGMSVYDGRKLQLIPLDSVSANPYVARTALYITNRRRIYTGREAIEKYYEQNINRQVKYQRVWVGEITLNFAELPEFVRDVTVEKDVLSPGRLFLSFKTGLKSPGYLGTTVGSEFYFLEDIVSLYLYAAKRRAEAFLQTDLRQIVLGRPVHFSTDPQEDQLAEQRLVHAAFRAGYEDVYLQYEPIAAAAFYETTIDHPQNVLIFDFGGGTLDITIARLGGPSERTILATGGVPIGGDIFDQKLVCAALPRHFGEGTSFRSDNRQNLPVPAHFYTAFADWQEMLELNKPDMLQILERIERTSNQRSMIRMLISLIKSSYSLKMYDAVEAAKRDLSNRIISQVALNGPGFNVREAVTRSKFELLIKDEMQIIADMLDEVVQQAGLRYDEIDAVIRTGGSAQIPAFIRLLDQRFGLEKVRAIDTFSSVTSGLGVIGRLFKQGEIDLRGYHHRDWTYTTTLQERSGVPGVDLDLMKKFIDLEIQSGPDSDQQVGIVAISPDGKVQAAMLPHIPEGGSDIHWNKKEFAPTSEDHLMIADPEQRVLLITSEYRFLLRTMRELMNLAELNLNLAQMESFYADQFGHETVSALVAWEDLQTARRLMLISSSGEAKIMLADALLPNLAQTHPYQLQRISGDPVALVPADDQEIVLITDMGSAAHIPVNDLPTGAQRIQRLRKGEQVTGAFTLVDPANLLLVTTRGHGKRLSASALDLLDGSGLAPKLTSGREQSVYVAQPDHTPIWAVTTHRLCTLDSLPDDDSRHPLLRLLPGETILDLR
jgi:hypothetical chaperone protein